MTEKTFDKLRAWMKRRLLLLGWSLLGLFGVPRRRILDNRSDNGEALRRDGFWAPSEYIENQAGWGAVRFGSKYTMAYGGCGIFAVYNTLSALGRPGSVELLESLLDTFQRRGAALGGKFGLSPESIRRFLTGQGFKVKASVPPDDAAVDAMSVQGEVFVVTACNGRRLRDRIHTVCITRDEQGQFSVHNGYHLVQQADGQKRYCANGPFVTLSEAVRHISSEGAMPLVVLAVSANLEDKE